MTIQDVAKHEGICERQAQRYCREPGYKGHILKATRLGRALSIAVEDYRAWRVECGFDFLPQPEAQQPELPRVSQGEVVAQPEPERPKYPPYPQVANPGGPITNVPHETSGSMPHPLAVRDYMERNARELKAKLLRGYDNEN